MENEIDILNQFEEEDSRWGDDLEFYDDEAEDDMESLAEDCTCGAYVWKNGKWYHVSDCIC